MEQKPLVLLAAHDVVRCEVLSKYLAAQGFEAAACHDGEAVLQLATEGSYDIVLLDDALPGITGIEVLRHIRRHGELPVVMLSATADAVERIVALELGADDYLATSCNLRELVARLNAILRRTRHANVAEKTRRGGQDSLSLSPAERSARWRGKPLPLTSTEFDLLELLFNHSGRTLDKNHLALTVLGRELKQFDRSLDMHISNLRKKLGRLPDGRSPIQTVHGSGYQLLRK
ncbi:MAG: response regulator transcription factor [Betaproteobacteria bacterium]|nr:response regulator transcription factor [Betaproteobacteria bacterium]